jgi:hypothetical protein
MIMDIFIASKLKIKITDMNRILILNVAILLIIGNTYACSTKKDVTVPEINSTENNSIDTEEEKITKTEQANTPNNTDQIESTEVSEGEVKVEQSKTDLHKHQIWDELTKKHVTEKGYLDYKGMIKDSTKLNKYLKQLSANHPNDSWTSDQRKAFWINAYNAFTVKLIVDNYPVKSIKDLGGAIYRVNTPWDIKFINIGKEEYHLNDLEHNILRKEWEDARIHAAVNCASISCPKIRAGAFTAENLEKQLDEQMRIFINDETKNVINEKSAKLSKLFKWFSGDFKNNAPSVIAYINKYSDTKLSEDADIDYAEYDWNLNDK